jgi:hypothetical protein
MRWLVATLGALGLAGGVYLGLQPRLSRPVLRIALNLRPEDPDDAALAAGVALALEDRNDRAGRWRLKTAHQTVRAKGKVEIPRPCAHTMLVGLESPEDLVDGDARRLFPVSAADEAERILEWMKSRGLGRIDTLVRTRAALPLTHRAEAAGIAIGRIKGGDAQTDPVYIPFLGGSRPPGFYVRYHQVDPSRGPVFLSGGGLSMADLPGLEGCYVVLATLRPAPPDFARRHPHPLAYVAYRGALRAFDALENRPDADPVAVAGSWGSGSAYHDLQEQAVLYQILGGRLEPSK